MFPDVRLPQKAQAAVVTVGQILEAPNEGPLIRQEQQGVAIEQFAQVLVPLSWKLELLETSPRLALSSS